MPSPCGRCAYWIKYIRPLVVLGYFCICCEDNWAMAAWMKDIASSTHMKVSFDERLAEARRNSIVL